MWQAIRDEIAKFISSIGAIGDHEDAITRATKAEKQKANQAQQLVKELEREIQAFLRSGRAGQRAANMLNRAFRAVTDIAIAKWLKDATWEALRFTEAMNLYAVAVGNAVDQTDRFIDVATQMYGLSYAPLYTTIGMFANLGTAIGLATDASAHMSMGLTKMSIDLAALFNMDPEDVFVNMASGMQGMSRAVRKYGIDIRVATLQQTAMNLSLLDLGLTLAEIEERGLSAEPLGIEDSVKNMNEANRVALRYLTMLKQARNAHGEFAKGIERPVEQIRILRQQLQELGRAIGNFVVVPLATALPYMNAFVMVLKEILFWLARFVGIQLPQPGDFQNIADGIDDIGDAAEGAAKRIRNLLAPFDELNIISQEQTSDPFAMEIDPRLLAMLMETNVMFEEIRMRAMDIRDEWLELLGFEWDLYGVLHFDSSQLQENLIDMFPEWALSITALFENWSGIINGFKSLWDALGGVIDQIIDKIRTFFGIAPDPILADFIENLSDRLERLAGWIERNEDLVASFIIAMGFLSFITQVIGWIAGFVAALFLLGLMIVIVGIKIYNFLKPLALAAGGLATLGPIGLVIAGVLLILSLAVAVAIGILAFLVTAFIVTYRTSEEFRDRVSNVASNIRTAFLLLGEIFRHVWNTMISPVLSAWWDAFLYLWNTILSRIFENIAESFVSIGNIATHVLNEFLLPFVFWMVSVFGGDIADTFILAITLAKLWAYHMGTYVEFATDILRSFLQIFEGLVTNDWRLALSGLVNLFIAAWNFISDVQVSMANFIITVINSMMCKIMQSVINTVNIILAGISGLLSFIGVTIDLSWGAKVPEIPLIEFQRTERVDFTLPKYEPNQTLGSGGQSVAHRLREQQQQEPPPETFADKLKRLMEFPTFNFDITSPNIDRFEFDSNFEFDFEKFNPFGDLSMFDNLPTRGATGPIEVRVILGGEEWDTFIYDSAEKGKQTYGARPVKVGAYV
jgi:hypothetical protein